MRDYESAIEKAERMVRRRAEGAWKTFFKAANIFVIEKKITIEYGTDTFGQKKEVVTPEFYVPRCTGRCGNIFFTFDQSTAEIISKLNMPAMLLPLDIPLPKTAPEMFDDMTCEDNYGKYTFNAYYIDGDWFGCAPLVLTSSGEGILSLCGADSHYYKCDEKATEHAYAEASAFFRNYRE